VRMLLARDDVDVNSKDNNGRTFDDVPPPLLLAANTGHRK